MTERIKILFLAADPAGSPESLDLGREYRDIEQAIRSQTHRDAFEFVSAWAVRASDLLTALVNHRPQIVHFAGHADVHEGIYLLDEYGNTNPVSKETLGKLFAALGGCVRLVVLNACGSHALSDAFIDVVDYVVGMNAPVEDHSAVAFATAFYGALAHGETVDTAFTMGVCRLELEGCGGTETPTLRVRRGVDRTRPLPPAPSAETDEPEPPVPGGGGIYVSGNGRVRNITSVGGKGHTTTIKNG